MDATSHVMIQLVGSDRPIQVQLAEGPRQEVPQGGAPRSIEADLPVTRFLPIKIWENGKPLWEGTVFLDGQQDVVLSFRLADEGQERVAFRIGVLPEAQSISYVAPDWVGAAWGGLVLGFCLVAVLTYRRVRA